MPGKSNYIVGLCINNILVFVCLYRNKLNVAVFVVSDVNRAVELLDKLQKSKVQLIISM